MSKPKRRDPFALLHSAVVVAKGRPPPEDALIVAIVEGCRTIALPLAGLLPKLLPLIA
jgi:hypothetical protein